MSVHNLSRESEQLRLQLGLSRSEVNYNLDVGLGEELLVNQYGDGSLLDSTVGDSTVTTTLMSRRLCRMIDKEVFCANAAGDSLPCIPNQQKISEKAQAFNYELPHGLTWCLYVVASLSWVLAASFGSFFSRMYKPNFSVFVLVCSLLFYVLIGVLHPQILKAIPHGLDPFAQAKWGLLLQPHLWIEAIQITFSEVAATMPLIAYYGAFNPPQANASRHGLFIILLELLVVLVFYFLLGLIYDGVNNLAANDSEFTGVSLAVPGRSAVMALFAKAPVAFPFWEFGVMCSVTVIVIAILCAVINTAATINAIYTHLRSTIAFRKISEGRLRILLFLIFFAVAVAFRPSPMAAK
eukprot:Blabericola_migrator_1__2673@NODE_175_length_12037_cov_81_938346_g152_i0_p5_GENE_NODE_175_length_12037_cov_81_938346_g152_i0NODE_175_length_12037_cov_81_938346_g152_i0_p5_ORF_typecomplete_len352_score41_87SNF/PF00209_18/9_9e06Fanconi_A/PF03511_14/3_1e03Fanconi_A/PF03511_14/53Fanconi_A/PF03511_14/0_65Fanconi_A/PF03511_14/2_1e03_NODE_175_length_12037_cov_81_938346_g152_i080339088